ncbi:ankyrin repeat domain-containing protein [Corynebacterium callunae]|uniref:ankyrin repeat domain-containing protein n=1 Tax=Corynebacterium callunae TaxID=1721 RepID=UPI001FFFB562|nr:ankyrin repeat domain-containing protein [Corynebacterium callunae]MCK2199555.1 ankyrin repeat domain-containing protein [Corynebacterium callunae]
MPRKLKEKLPRNFDKIVESGDFDAFKEVFAERALDARNRHGDTALHIPEVPEEYKIWLLKQGLDVDVRNEEGDTPLHVHAQEKDLNTDFLIGFGADVCAVNNEGESVAYGAVLFPQKLKKLIDAGADPSSRTNDGHSPMMQVIRSADVNHISQLAKTVKMLNSSDFTEEEIRETQERIIRLGEQFEDAREDYDQDYVDEAAVDMVWLYDRFGIPEELRANTPVRHDGISQIKLPGETWQEQFIAGYDFLVPAVGKAKSLQGEAIRIAGRVSNEFHDNGGENWDKDYRKMAKALLSITSQGTPLKKTQEQELATAIKAVRKGDPTPEEVDVLPRLATAWVVQNPNPMPLGEPDYQR